MLSIYKNVEYLNRSKKELGVLIFDLDDYMGCLYFEYIKHYKLPFGKHKGKRIHLLLYFELNYIKYLVENKIIKDPIMLHYLHVGIQRQKIQKHYIHLLNSTKNNLNIY